jgi:hypothetical protein
MRCAVGFSVHTGWAACVIAAGSIERPRIELRDRIELLGDADRFVFHRAAEMRATDAKAFVTRAGREARVAATRAMKRIAEGRALAGCAIVAGAIAMPPLDVVVASHPMMHTAEGLFYRDALKAAAQAAGLRTQIVTPKSLDIKRAELAEVGRAVGKPWNTDVKLAALAAWALLAPSSRKG